jgi:hypothetical protein
MVTVEDAYGNTATTNTSAVTLTITAGTGTSGAALTCTSANPPNSANPLNAVGGSV